MTRRVFFGEGKQAGALLPWLTSDGLPWLTSDDQPWETSYFEQELAPWLDTNGDPWLTDQQEPWLAVVSGAAPPKYWMTADVTVDGSFPFSIFYKSNPFQPSKQGGENLFTWLFLSLSWSMGGTIRVRSFCDGKRDTLELPDGSIVRYIDTTFQLPQAEGTLQRKSAVFPIPLLRLHESADGEEIARYALRGERYQFLIDTPDPLGVGELLVDGAELEYEPLRKAEYESVTTVAGDA